MKKLSILELNAFKSAAQHEEEFWNNAYSEPNDKDNPIDIRNAELAAAYYNNVVTSIEGEILNRIEKMFGKIPERDDDDV